jgi:hypothetical protein
MNGRWANDEECAICVKRDYLRPLHGDAGGPMCCLLCIGKWHAEHGRRRRLGRIVIRAMVAFLAGGGKSDDLDKLMLSAIAGDIGVLDLDPLGYMAGTARTNGETADLTSELLADTLKLTHPDHHPPERGELAERVTKGLLALQSFVFPAPPPPKTVSGEPEWRSLWADNRDGHRGSNVNDAPRFPCAGCADTIPLYYCTACRTEAEKREREEAERARAKQREWYVKRPKMWTPPKPAKGAPRPRTARQARVANQVQSGNLINQWLSGLQIAILRAAYDNRVPGSRGCDVSHAELLAEIWGWEPSRHLRWTEEALAPWRSDKNCIYRLGDTRAQSDTHGAFNHIPPYQRRSARASLTRALARLEQRMLISFVSGTMGTYCGGLVLTPHGEQMACQMVEHEEAEKTESRVLPTSSATSSRSSIALSPRRTPRLASPPIATPSRR